MILAADDVQSCFLEEAGLTGLSPGQVGRSMVSGLGWDRESRVGAAAGLGWDRESRVNRVELAGFLAILEPA